MPTSSCCVQGRACSGNALENENERGQPCWTRSDSDRQQISCESLWDAATSDGSFATDWSDIRHPTDLSSRNGGIHPYPTVPHQKTGGVSTHPTDLFSESGWMRERSTGQRHRRRRRDRRAGPPAARDPLPPGPGFLVRPPAQDRRRGSHARRAVHGRAGGVEPGSVSRTGHIVSFSAPGKEDLPVDNDPATELDERPSTTARGQRAQLRRAQAEGGEPPLPAERARFDRCSRKRRTGALAVSSIARRYERTASFRRPTRVSRSPRVA